MSRSTALRPMTPKAVGRLAIYRRVLAGLAGDGIMAVHSQDIARLAGMTSSLVRQDLMRVGYRGNPQHGYDVGRLDAAIAETLGGPRGDRAVLLGVGNLGRAILQYFRTAHPGLQMVAAFETDVDLVTTRCHGVPVRHLLDLEEIVGGEQVRIAILAVPARVAQSVTDRLVCLGVRSILNFTSTTVRAPAGTYVENHDIGLALERVAYFAQRTEEVPA
ncbi:MAG: redox-sensing transcriptional repressor Rex [Candidatus Krumholzibacteriia bacterium]